MSRRAIALLAASIIVASGATVSTDAFASKKVAHHRAAAVAVVAPAPVVVGVGFIDNNYGPVASGIPRCFDSAVYYPLPPCY